MGFVKVVVAASMMTLQVNGLSFSELKATVAPSAATFLDKTDADASLTTDEENRIYGGMNANIHKHPYMVGLRSEGPYGGTFCGGALIAPQYVLTAGHCFEWNLTDVYVSLGSSHSSGPGHHKSEQIRVAEIYRHPQFNMTWPTNDVGLLKLETPSQKKSVPLCAANGSDNEPGTMATALGWGMVNNVSSSNTLQTIDVEIITNEQCVELTDDGSVVEESVMCAWIGKGKGSCYGDSGGPLIANGAIVGIDSYAVDDECGVKPEFYTRVAYVLDYINDILNGGSSGNMTEKLIFSSKA